MTTPVGLDVGYGYTKGVCPEKAVIFPSVVGPTSGQVFSFEGRGVPRVSFEGREYVCGDAALKHSPSPVEVRSRDFVNTEVYKILLIWGLTELGVSDAAAVLGLPVPHFQGLRERVERYSGTYTVHLEGQQRTITLEVLKVVPQPAGTIFDMIMDYTGEAVSEDFLEKTVGVIDVGYYTTDLVVFEDLQFVSAKTGGSELGISVLLNRVAERLEATFGTSFSLREAEKVLTRGRVRYQGKEYPLDFQEELEQFASAVIALARNFWGDPGKLDEIIVTGGGANLLESKMKEEIPHARLAPKPVFANVRGFFKYAVRLLRRRK